MRKKNQEGNLLKVGSAGISNPSQSKLPICNLLVRLRNEFTKFVLTQVVTICTTCFGEITLSAEELFFVNEYLRSCILENFAKHSPL